MTVRTYLAHLDDASVGVIAILYGTNASDPSFQNLAYEAERDGILADCRRLGDYARALLSYRLEYLNRLACLSR